MNKKAYQYQDKKVGLRVLAIDDLEGNYPKWFIDDIVCRYNSHGAALYTLNQLKQYILSLDEDKSKYVWAIDDIETNRHIGNVSLQEINFVNRSAELAILLGEREFWGRAYAQQACAFVLSHAFKRLNLNRIHCATASNNTGMIKLAEKLNMKQEGVRRRALFLNGSYQDSIEFGILSEEYFL